MKRLFALLTACTAITCVFASCGDKKEESSANDTSVSESTSAETVTETTDESSQNSDVTDSSFVGKWECSKLVANGEELDELAGLPIYAVFQYDVREDGTVELPESLMEISDQENPVSYTWKSKSDNEIEIVGSNDSSIVYSLENGQLVNISGTEEIYLDKVDEFKDFDFKGYYDELMAQQENQYVLTPVETDADGNIIETVETTTAE